MKDISPCGANCTDCSFLEQCKGCNAVKGFVFYCDGKECPLHACCREKEYANCGQCSELPCAKYIRMRDPRMSDDQFQESIDRRIETMREINEMK